MTSLTLPASTYGQSIRRYRRIGLALLALFGIGFAAWSATAPLASAVIAVGRLEVSGSIKKVQHETGGTVAEILTSEGARVSAGQILLRLDPTAARAALEIVEGKRAELEMAVARLKAERDGLAQVDLPALFEERANDPGVLALLKTEQRLFAVRVAARQGQKDQLNARVDQLSSQIAGLETQKKAKDRELELTRGELVDAHALLDQQIAPQSRVNDLERDLARLEGERGQINAEIAELGARIAETRLQVLSIDQVAIADASRELNDDLSAIAELTQRQLAAADQLARTDIKAPIDGTVHQLEVHTVGGVIAPGEVLLTVVPSAGVLDIEARVSPADIESVRQGGAAVVRLPGLNYSTTPELDAVVRVVGADLVDDPVSHQAYYPVTLDLVDGQEERLGGIDLVPGMPVETFISGPDRTFLDYLIQPIRDRMSHAMREQ